MQILRDVLQNAVVNEGTLVMQQTILRFNARAFQVSSLGIRRCQLASRRNDNPVPQPLPTRSTARDTSTSNGT
jgi:hypothetical protein